MNLEKLESYVDEYIVSKEEKDGYVVYNCGDRGLCKITVYPDGSYECNFDDLCGSLEGFMASIEYYHQMGFADMDMGIPVLVDGNTGLRYFNDKDAMNAIKNDAKDLLKKSMNKDSFVRAHIYQELIKMGYEYNFRLTDVNTDAAKYLNGDTLSSIVDSVSKEIYIRNFKYKNGTSFDGETMVHYRNGQGYVDNEMDEIVEIIQNVFGTNSKEINELFGHFIDFDNKNEANFKQLFAKSGYVHVVSDMFKYAVIQYEKQYCRYIADNVKINFSLKQAYSVLSDELKTQLAEEIFQGDSLETKLIGDIVDIFSRKCSRSGKKSYSREEIIRFLIDNSAKKVPLLMPEDFDVFSELGKSDNSELIGKYEEIASQEDYGGKPRK